MSTIKPKHRRKRAAKQDVDVMGKLGGRVQPASGSLIGYKGDGRVIDRFRVETKYTQANSFSLKLSELWKIGGECEGSERPMFVIDFLEKGTGKLRGRYAVIPFSDMEKLNDANTTDD